MFPKRTAQAKAKVVVEGTNKVRDNSNKGKAPGSKKRQRPQEQPKSKLTIGWKQAQTETPFLLAQ